MIKELDDAIQELAAGLRDAIHDTPDSALEGDPRAAFVDLARRLTARLAVIPHPMAPEAAVRALDILTYWLRQHPVHSYKTTIDADGKFEITVLGPSGESTAFFRGSSMQNAYAQAAQTIALEGGSL
jgi:hypothetical protein